MEPCSDNVCRMLLGIVLLINAKSSLMKALSKSHHILLKGMFILTKRNGVFPDVKATFAIPDTGFDLCTHCKPDGPSFLSCIVGHLCLFLTEWRTSEEGIGGVGACQMVLGESSTRNHSHRAFSTC